MKPRPPDACEAMTFHIMLRHTGLAEWQWDAAMAAGLIPPPDVDGHRWSAAVADAVAARYDEIIAAVGTEAPVGGHRAADRLARRTGLKVEKRRAGRSGAWTPPAACRRNCCAPA